MRRRPACPVHGPAGICLAARGAEGPVCARGSVNGLRGDEDVHKNPTEAERCGTLVCVQYRNVNTRLNLKRLVETLETVCARALWSAMAYLNTAQDYLFLGRPAVATPYTVAAKRLPKMSPSAGLMIASAASASAVVPPGALL